MRKTILTAAVTTILIVTGCGTSQKATTPEKPDHNDADVTFAQMMIPHHEQAIEMSELATSRAATAEVKELAGQIEAAQDPEIQTMKGWLKAWGEDEMSDHMGHDMPGIMSDETMADLKQATGADFDRLFLTSMIDHHEGAIEMAEAEKEDGKFPAALKLADAIITTQAAEIKQMRAMLK
jgi:uncharacterized protein (DUF305 family)